MRANQIVYLLFGLLIFAGLKLGFKYSSTDDINILLGPTNYFFSLVQNTEWQYSSDLGYYHPEYNIVINKSCSGGNFLLICFLCFLFSCLDHIRSFMLTLGYIIGILIGSYIVSILSNVSRIIILLRLNQFGIARVGWGHEAAGGFVYLVMLVLFFYLLKTVLVLKSTMSKSSKEFTLAKNKSAL